MGKRSGGALTVLIHLLDKGAQVFHGRVEAHTTDDRIQFP